REGKCRKQHEETVRDRPADERSDHLRAPYSGTLASALGASAPSMRVPLALKLASESMRNWPDTTTLSPSESPLRISLLPPDSKPSSTSRGRNLPSLSATMTTLRSPVRMTASEGTSSALLPVPCAKTSVANIPGFNR